MARDGGLEEGGFVGIEELVEGALGGGRDGDGLFGAMGGYGMEGGGEIAGADGVVGGGDDGAFHGIFEFADVARPRIIEEGGGGFGGDFADFFVVLRVEKLDEMAGEGDDVAASACELWDDDGEDIEPIVEVFAEEFALHEFFEVSAGGGDEADIGVEFFVGADA